VTPLLMAVDGNSLLHRAHHAHVHSGQRDLAGRPTWGLRGMVAQIGSAAARLTPDAVLIAFDHGDPLRRDDYPEYKAGRTEKTPELAEQIECAPDLLASAGFAVVRHEGWEADDCLASAAARARDQGWRCTVVTSDRDSFALIDETTSVLRVITGGIDASPVLTPGRMPMLYGIRAEQYRDYAALRGDSSDNLPGAVGIGAKTAAKLLAGFDSVDDAYRAIDEGREDEVVAVVGPAATRRLADPVSRSNVARNQRLMALRDDLELPGHDGMRVPMDLLRIQSVLRERDIHLGPSLWALTGSAPPGTDRWAALAEQDDVRAPDPLVEAVPAPRAAAVVVEDREEQLSLF
jgi:DNA polymerase-1